MLDTTVLISALRSRNGAAAAVLDMALALRGTLLLDYRLASEYRDVAFRPEHMGKSDLSAEEIGALIDALENLAEPVEILIRHRPLCIDQNDDLVLDLAINGRADCIVTSNLRHLEAPASEFGIAVPDARRFLVTMRKEG